MEPKGQIMGKKNPEKTPRSKVRNALRMLFLRSRERGFAIKRDAYSCQKCGVKQSKARGREVSVEVHHRAGICNWDIIIDLIYQQLLCPPDGMETLCKECHGAEMKTAEPFSGLMGE